VRVAACAFLKAIRPLELEQGEVVVVFFYQRMRIARLRFSQEWQPSTTHRRARQPGVRALSLISSPRVRICAEKAVLVGELMHRRRVVGAIQAQPLRRLRRRLGALDRDRFERRR
jgi:hypothetical protein